MVRKIKFVLIGIFAGLVISGLQACSKEADLKTPGVSGVWARSFVGGIQKYQFNSDSTFIFADLATTINRPEILGYRYKSTGKYHLKNSTLSLYDVKIFSSNGDYSKESALVETAVSNSPAVYTVKQQQRTLSLSFDCPINASCILSPLVFIRQ